MHGVAHEHDVVRGPMGTADRGEAAPDAVVGDQLVALELLREEGLAVRERVRLRGLVHPGGLPGLFGALDDERRAAGLILVRVHSPESVFGLSEVEGERRERLGRP